MTADTLLCTRFSILYFIGQAFVRRSRQRVYYFDLYSKSQTLLTWILIKWLGRERTNDYLVRIFRKFHLNLQPVPHADAMNDYHWLNIQSHRLACELTENWMRAATQADFIFPTGLLESECQQSLIYKSAADRLWHIVENLDVLKSLNRNNICLRIPRCYLPGALVDALAKKTGTSVQFETTYSRFFGLPFLLAYLLTCLARNALKTLLPVRKQAASHHPGVAVELAHPQCMQGQVSHANYMVPTEADSGEFIFYVRGERTSFFKKYSLAKSPVPVVFLNRLRLHWQDVGIAAACYTALLHDFIWRGMPFYVLTQRLRWIALFLELSAFFRHYPVAAHVYNTFVNADKISVRLDAGLVTGICRRFDVTSISYQTRVNYLDSYYFYFDVFDVYCSWGADWQLLIADKSFIRRHHLIGNVYSKYSFGELGTASALNTIVLFNSDMEMHFPQHHTLSYNVTFLTMVLDALDALPAKPSAVLLKAKNRNEAEKLLSHPLVQERQRSSAITLTMMEETIHDIWSAIAIADAVISVGFTTPGMCALSAGKKSLYATPYAYPYNTVFTIDQPFIAHNVQALTQKLLTVEPLSQQAIRGLDGYSDGRAASRLYELCRQIVDEKHHDYS